MAPEVGELARQVTSGPPCRVCGYPMEPGFLHVASGSPLTTSLQWHDEDDAADRPGGSVETLTWGPYGRYHALKGFRCPECRRLEVGYGNQPAPSTRSVPSPLR